MWYLFHGLLLLACALALTPSVVDSFCSLVPVTSLWFERVRSSSWGPTLVQHIVSTDTKPCKRPAVVFYFLGLWCSPPFRAACCTQQLCVPCSCALLLYIGCCPGCCSGAHFLGCCIAGDLPPRCCWCWCLHWPGLCSALARISPCGPATAGPGQAAQGPVCAVSVGPSADGQARGSVSGCGAEGLIGGRGRILTGACSYDTCL